MRPTSIPPLRPLAVLLLTAAATVWVVGDHWGEGAPSVARHWAWTAGAALLCTASVWLLGLAEVDRRRRWRRTARRPRLRSGRARSAAGR